MQSPLLSAAGESFGGRSRGAQARVIAGPVWERVTAPQTPTPSRLSPPQTGPAGRFLRTVTRSKWKPRENPAARCCCGWCWFLRGDVRVPGSRRSGRWLGAVKPNRQPAALPLSLPGSQRGSSSGAGRGTGQRPVRGGTSCGAETRYSTQRDSAAGRAGCRGWAISEETGGPRGDAVPGTSWAPGTCSAPSVAAC